MRFSRPVAFLSVAALASSLALAPSSAAPPRNVDRPPAYAISGAATGLDVTHADNATDQAGRTIALVEGAVLVFAPGARGNAAPQRTIQLPATPDEFPLAVTVDGDGFIYVLTSDFAGDAWGTTFMVFAPGASGTAVPVFTTTGDALGLDQPLDITDRGDLLAVLENQTNAVFTFDLRDSSTEAVGGIDAGSGTQTRIFQPYTINSDSSGRLALVGAGAFGLWVGVFGPSANGDVAPQQYIAGESTGLGGDYGYASFAPGGELIVSAATEGADNNYVDGTVVRFAPNATGDAVPENTLAGPASGLDATYHSDVTSDGRIVTSEWNGTTFALEPEILVHAPIGPYTAPAKVRGLKVSGKKRASKRTVTWGAASTQVDVPVTGYKVRVICKATGKKKAKGKKKVTRLNKTVKRTRVTVKLKSFKRGRCTTQVRPVNVVGLGPGSRKQFAVKR